MRKYVLKYNGFDDLNEKVFEFQRVRFIFNFVLIRFSDDLLIFLIYSIK